MLKPYPDWDSRQLGNTFLLQRRNLKTEAMLETNTSCISCLQKIMLSSLLKKKKKKTICNENTKSIHLIFYNPDLSILGDVVTARVSVNVDNIKLDRGLSWYLVV